MVKNFVIAGLLVAVLILASLVMDTSDTVPHMPSPTTDTGADGVVCAQVITPALDPETDTIVEFPTPCDVPEGWEVIQNDIPDLELDLQ